MKSSPFFISVSVILATSIGVYLGVEPLILLVNALVATWVFLGIFATYHENSGWGVGYIKGKLLQGIQLWKWVMYTVVVMLLVHAISLLASDLGDSTSTGLFSFFVSVLLGIVSSILYWLLVMKEENRLVAHYDIRESLHGKGCSDQEIEVEIDRLVGVGIIGPR